MQYSMLDEKKIFEAIENIRPSKDFARNLIDDLPVTKSEEGSSFIMKIKNLFEARNIMANKWRFLIPTAAVILIVAIVGIGKFAEKAPSEFAFESNVDFSRQISNLADDAVKNAPKATGDFNDAVNAMLAFSESEEILLSEESSDMELIAAEIEVANNLSEIYDENEL